MQQVNSVHLNWPSKKLRKYKPPFHSWDIPPGIPPQPQLYITSSHHNLDVRVSPWGRGTLSKLRMFTFISIQDYINIWTTETLALRRKCSHGQDPFTFSSLLAKGRHGILKAHSFEYYWEILTFIFLTDVLISGPQSKTVSIFHFNDSNFYMS